MTNQGRETSSPVLRSAYRASAPTVCLYAAPRDFTKSKGEKKKEQECLRHPYVPGENTVAVGQFAKKQQMGFLLLVQTKTDEKTPPWGA